MRISKSSKTDVKAAKSDFEYEVQGNYGYGWDRLTTEATMEEAKEQKKCYDENEPNVPHRIKTIAKGSVDACDDVKASKKVCASAGSKASLEDRKGRFVVGRDFNTKDWWVYDDNTDSQTYYFDTEEEANDFVDTIVNLPNYSEELPYGGYKPAYADEDIEGCGDIKASKKVSADDKALQHIKAAIDILGKSGKKDDITKDSIANLATVMFDIKGRK